MPHFDLCVIGTGSGNSIVDKAFDHLSVAMVDDGPAFGGTCLNVGCIPTKMFVLPADFASTPQRAARLGVDLRLEGTDWPAIRDRIFDRIDPIAAAGEEYRRDAPNVTLYRRRAEFVGDRRLRLDDGTDITADRVVVAAGSRSVRPDIAGLDDVDAHTSDTIMRLPELPSRLAIIGGGYIAAEFGHIFSALGTEVTVVARSEQLLRTADDDVSRRFTDLMSEQVDVRLQSTVQSAERLSDGTARLTLKTPDGSATLDVDTVLIATGRRPNGDRLAVERAGIQLDEDGFVVVDAHQRTTAEGVYALGDVSSHHMLKHVANQEARVVRHNLLHPDDPWRSNHEHIPQAVFTEPQVAWVGPTERDLVRQGRRYVASTVDYASTAYGWALEDTTSFCKLLADPATGSLLGAHVIGPNASILLQPIVQGMVFGQRAPELARRQYWPHPALTEVVENALLGLEIDS